MIHKLIFFLGFFYWYAVISAQDTIDSIQKIEEVIIQTKRIAIPFSASSHSVSIIRAKDIAAMGITSLDEILQQLIGVDVRRRGIKGMQSDLYIRGGNFNQTLVLIEGIKMDDLQSGHHIMNALLNVDTIDRIEVIRGAASRIYGQNAMNGAINIVTKKVIDTQTKLNLFAGSYNNYGVGLLTQRKSKNGSILLQFDTQQSDGYRYNTDFSNANIFFKTTWKDYKLLFSYGRRNFGANGFYASPDYKEQYEETRTHLLAVSHTLEQSAYTLYTHLFWRRNQDMYVFLRDNPDYYQNFHTNNKIGAEAHVSIDNALGISGIGIELSRGFLQSTNLGNHNRTSVNMFLEHRFQLAKTRFDITPGLAMAYYSDFKYFVYPDIDLGYRFSKAVKVYANVGYTSRIPTYTNLYYESPLESGNPDLKPEKALTYDFGLHFTKEKYRLNLAYFIRNSENLIDWIKTNPTDIWQASNFNSTQTQGIEMTAKYTFRIHSLPQRFRLGFTKISDRISGDETILSRYSLSSFRYRLVSEIDSHITKNWQTSLIYSFTDRLHTKSYHILDFSTNLTLKKWRFGFRVNNLLNATYTETNLVPMPKRNLMSSVSFSL